jgi:hypothetical protein
MLNGVQTGSIRTFSGGDKSIVAFITSASNKDYLAEEGDRLEVQAKTNHGSPTPNDVIIEVYGIEI